MANANSPFGLRPVRTVTGRAWNGAANPYWAPAAYATALFNGDPVVRTGAMAVGPTGETLPVVSLITAGATNQITGAVTGFEPTPDIVANGYGAASTLRKVYVADAPDLIFEIQEDAVGGAIALASVGLNCNLIAGNGSAYTKKSGWLLDSSTVLSDASYQVRIHSPAQRADNEVPAAYGKWLVTINLHTERLAPVAGL